MEEFRSELEQAQAARAEAEQVLQRLSYEHRSLAERREEQEERLAEIDSSLQDYSESLSKTTEGVEQAAKALESIQEKRKKAETDFQQAETAHRDAAEAYNETRIEAVQAKNRLESLQREKHHVNEGLQTIAEQEEKRAAEADQLHQDIEDAEKKAEELEEAIKTAYHRKEELQTAVHEAERVVTQLRSSISEREMLLREVRRIREEKMNEQNERSKKLAQLEARLEDLDERIAEEYDMDLAEADIELDEDFDESHARSRVAKLRKKLRRLGAVNELALENYEEEKDRLEFLQSQQEDLEQSEETLLQTIDEINQTATERFSETFSAIQKHFSRLFTELFGEGTKAELRIDGDHPLDAPIRITAKPRGKKPSTLAQLSGGEKTLTAIALLFAIYLVKPSPFCILDEVDAPLDDANVNRFMRLIRRFADSTQFILVTHNKQTMEAADRLYGVTMQEQGVSTLVGVKFDEALDLVA